MNFKLLVGVDGIQDLPDCLKTFLYRQPLLPNWVITDVPSECSGCIIGTCGHADLGFVPYPLRTIRKYLDPQVLASLMSCSIFETSTLCSASKNLTSRWLDYGACKCLIDT